MSGEIVNLRRFRKAKQRAAEADVAAQNRLRFGRSRTQCAFEAAVENREQRLFEAHRRDGSIADGGSAQSDRRKDEPNGP